MRVRENESLSMGDPLGKDKKNRALNNYASVLQTEVYVPTLKTSGKKFTTVIFREWNRSLKEEGDFCVLLETSFPRSLCYS